MSKDYKFGFAHYWNYFKVNYIISLKSLFEYKSNFYSSFLAVVMWNLSIILFGFVLEDFFILVGLNFVEYLTIMLFTIICINFGWLFLENKHLEYLIVRGYLNRFLSIPGNSFFNFLFHFKFNNLIVVLMNILMYGGYIVMFSNYTLSYWYLIVLILFLSIILNVFVFQFINAINFISFGASLVLFNLNDSFAGTNLNYSPLFFEKLKYSFFLFLLPVFFIAKLIIPLFNGIIIDDFLFYFSILVGINIFFIITTLLLWRYGLQKYSAYG